MSWRDDVWIGFDLETSGKYPLGADICEFGAVKFRSGAEVERLNFLIKPREYMSDEVIGIHNITNEMVADAPRFSEIAKEIYDFLQGGLLVAHHAPFDMGFLSFEFEKLGFKPLQKPVVCTSLLSRSTVKGTENFKLQTLVDHFNIEGGQAHRATDDASSCLQVLFKIIEEQESNGLSIKSEDIFSLQKRKLYWSDFLLSHLEQYEALKELVEGCRRQCPFVIRYKGGSKPNQNRVVFPQGLVRTPNGDFLVATDSIESEQVKRFYLSRVLFSSLDLELAEGFDS